MLSRAFTARHEQLQRLASEIVEGFEFVFYSEQAREERLRQLTTELAGGRFKSDDLVTLLRVADVGICDAEVSERELPEHLKEYVILALHDVVNLDTGERVEFDLPASRGYYVLPASNGWLVHVGVNDESGAGAAVYAYDLDGEKPFDLKFCDSRKYPERLKEVV